MKTRTEKDSIGSVKVAADRYWGSQTQRALQYFQIGSQTFPRAMTKALGIVKKAAALTNCDLRKLDREKCRLICIACDEVIDGKLEGHFPLVVWQSGSGTQTNMNANEVIANRANELAGQSLGNKNFIHPNDHVNMSQSTNDSFPTCMHIATVELTTATLLPALQNLIDTFTECEESFKDIIKVGRTHLMDATPISLGQEFCGYKGQLQFAYRQIENSLKDLYEIALGGSSVGTGINTHPKFASWVAKRISEITDRPFRSIPNKFMALSSHQAILKSHDALKSLAVACAKIANDIQFMASGPRSGLAEISLPNNEPGSSIMPGKSNPTQCEAMIMVAVKIMGNNTIMTNATSSGHFELNTMKPLLIHTLLESIQLLGDACRSFNENCVAGIKPKRTKINQYLQNSLMLATALNEHIGYDEAVKIVQKAIEEGTTIREAAINLGTLEAQTIDSILQLDSMVKP